MGKAGIGQQLLPSEHAVYPAAQVKLHEVPLQVAVALDGAVHGVQEFPQACTLVVETQLPEHKW